MINEGSVIIKSYQYLVHNWCIAIFLMFFIPLAPIMIIMSPFPWVVVSILGPFSGFFLLMAIITRFGCSTYDIFTKDGIKRIRKGKVLFNIPWENVGSLTYIDLIGIIVFLRPHVLTVRVKKYLELYEKRNYDTRGYISMHINVRKLREIRDLLPLDLAIKYESLFKSKKF